MRSITLKAALAALIVTVPLSGALAANGNGGTGGNSHGSNGDVRGPSDGIGSLHQYPTTLGMTHYGSTYNRSNNRPISEPMDPIGEGLRQLLGVH